jgi:hypothetical protein
LAAAVKLRHRAMMAGIEAGCLDIQDDADTLLTPIINAKEIVLRQAAQYPVVTGFFEPRC